jgi:hypothetical protein|tara:strand:+ start:180 stop:1880 length:1701 start_codon:yes stop_codon:yes gene_type:complete
MASSGNFCLWNVLSIGSGGSTSLTVGHTTAVMTGADPRTVGTVGNPISDTDGYYFETVATSIGDGALTLGIINDERSNRLANEQIHSRSGSFMWRSYDSGQFMVETSTNTSYGTFASGDVLGWFVKNSKLYVKKNNSDVVGDVAAGSGGIDISGNFFFPAVSRTVGGGSQTTAVLRPDSDSWSYTPPTGFKGLTSKDMGISSDIDPAQTDDAYPSKNFGAITWTGDGTTGRAITGLGFQPDFIWFKDRTQAFSNRLYDTSRGIDSNGGKRLFSNTNGAETDQTSGQDISAVGSDGFTLGASDANYTNYNNDENVAWCWRMNGGTTATNNDGNVTTTVQANQAAGQSIVLWTGTGTNSRTLGHGLTKKPGFVIVKRRPNSQSWNTWSQYHDNGSEAGEYGALMLESSNAFSNGSGALKYWYPSGMTSTTIGIGGASGNNNSGEAMLAYCFHDVDGYSKFHYWKGNGSTDGPFIYCGFRPRMVFWKCTDATENWQVRDTARSTFNDDSQVRIYWNSSSAESSASTASPIDFLSNGFKIRGSNTEVNGSGNHYVWGAFADVPFKYNNTF